jgi:hypothetical protein
VFPDLFSYNQPPENQEDNKMPRFPISETDTIVLAQLVANGIANNPTTFPNPPVLPAVLTGGITDYNDKINEIQASEAATRLLVQEKNASYDIVRQGTRDLVDYAQIVAKGNPAILELIGWGPRAEPQALQPPGQPRYFEIIGQGDGYARFDWKEPLDGGEVAAYNLMRAEDGANFVIAGTFTASEGAVFEQPTGKKLFYNVVALNRAGSGVASNTVSVVL